MERCFDWLRERLQTGCSVAAALEGFAAFFTRRIEHLRPNNGGLWADAWSGLRLWSPSEELDRRLHVEDIDCTELQDVEGWLRGTVVVTIGRQGRREEMGRGENGHSMQKAGRKPVLDWQIGGRRRVEARPLRLELARAEGVPPYVIFHDATLAAMLDERPSDLEEMGALPGIGRHKLEKYGRAFLERLEGLPG